MKKSIVLVPFLASACVVSSCGKPQNQDTSSSTTPPDTPDTPIQPNPPPESNYTGISLGGVGLGGGDLQTTFLCGVSKYGTAFCAGSNYGGRLGNGKNLGIQEYTSNVLDIKNFHQISSGYATSCGVTSEGTGWCWGDNSYGQLGNGTNIGSTVPTSVSGNLKFTTISQNGGAACGISDSKVWCWGNNDKGQLGNGTNTNSSVPVQTSTSFADFKQISLGFKSACALRENGEAWCWGANNDGQLGNGTTTSSSVPVQVYGGINFVSLSERGYYSFCGIAKDGKTYCWGNNSGGQLGNGTTTNSSVPVQVSNVTNFKQISIGALHACGVTSDGKAYCWGYNFDGELGNGTTTDSDVPVQVSNVSNFKQVSAAYGQTCGLTGDDKVYCWGVGIYDPSGTYPVPELLNFNIPPSPSPTEISSVSVGYSILGTGFSCATKSSGTMWCLGTNDKGQLGNGSVSPLQTVATPVSDITNFFKTSTGGTSSCGVDKTGTGWCWGANNDGQLGNGTNTNSNVPVQVSNVGNFTDISTSMNGDLDGDFGDTACGISDGTLWCWGNNSDGQLGNGTTTNSNVPVKVNTSFSDFKSIRVGAGSVCALRENGETWCWGNNAVGQLGNGSKVGSFTPVKVSGGLIFTDIAGKGAHFCGLTVEKMVYCWGANFYGQLGNGTTTDSDVPVQVLNVSNFKQISAGSEHTCGVTSDGKAYCWGDAEYGQLGDGESGIGFNIPRRVANIQNFSSIDVYDSVSCGLTTSGNVFCWGLDLLEPYSFQNPSYNTIPILLDFSSKN